MGLAYRTDFDLSNIANESGKSMEYRDKVTGETFVPHVIEPSIGVERLFLAVLSNAYTEDEVNGEKRFVLKLPENLAPYRFCVSPLLKNKPELVEKAKEVYQILREKYKNVTWDDSGNIGKRYRKQDEKRPGQRCRRGRKHALHRRKTASFLCPGDHRGSADSGA